MSKSHPVSREILPPSNLHVDKSSLCPTFPISARSACPASLSSADLAHEELFSTRPHHRSLLLIHRLQVALDFAAVYRCRTIACRCSTRFIRSASFLLWVLYNFRCGASEVRLAHFSQFGLVLLTSSPSPRVRARCSPFREPCAAGSHPSFSRRSITSSRDMCASLTDAILRNNRARFHEIET